MILTNVLFVLRIAGTEQYVALCREANGWSAWRARDRADGSVVAIGDALIESDDYEAVCAMAERAAKGE
jgi:thymidine kinase